MSIIQLKEANCKNCYKCIRNCDVKSISFQNDQAQIIDDDCVLCGKCTLICPQNAKQIQSDVQKVQSMIDRGEKVYVSLAPSFVAGFPQQSFAGVVKALRRLGFAGVEETAIAATKVSERYGEILARGAVPNLITTCCPTINMLVEKYFPELIDQLASVPSPAVAHSFFVFFHIRHLFAISAKTSLWMSSLACIRPPSVQATRFHPSAFAQYCPAWRLCCRYSIFFSWMSFFSSSP